MSDDNVLPIEDPADNVSQDFFLGDIHNGLERMRRRLLDLTNRNRLLNFRETRSSTLKVVDEIPDLLYKSLLSGREMTFRAVPSPKKHSLFDDDEGVKDDVKAVAEKYGIDPSFELPPLSADSNSPSHSDNEIQTLCFPDKLEALLTRISGGARLAIEETGTNMLYLVFGFLEWFDTDQSETRHLAPLLLLPVSLRRGDADPVTKTFRYYISYSGEDIVPNLSLEEKMRADFHIELPSLDEDDTPEKYFVKFDPVCSAKERWTVHRNVTLTLLSFGKLLMYRDLDPTNWPAGTEISNHPRIREFFEGIQADGIAIAKDYDLDEPDLGIEVPRLIDNADSSQHSVVIDALAGKNLVVQGPPGTGKSQTITNLIAAALVAGKTVLFVSEKLAALEVVRRRLDSAGLGLFCLELHSNKTKKDGVLQDVAERIDMHRRFRSVRSIHEQIELLEEQKSQLRDYALAIGKRFGASGKTVHEIFWKRESLHRKLGFADSLVALLRVPKVESHSSGDIDRGVQAAENFGKHLQDLVDRNGGPAVAVYEALKGHPWYGVRNANLTFADQAVLAAHFEYVLNLLNQIDSTFEELIHDVVLGSAPESIELGLATLSSILRFGEMGVALGGTDVNGIESTALPYLVRDGASNQVLEFLESVEKYRSMESVLSRIFKAIPDLSESEIDKLLDAVIVLRNQFGKVKFSEATRVGGRLQFLEKGLDEALDSYTRLTEVLSFDLRDDLEGVETLVKTLGVIDEAPSEFLASRQTGLELDGALGTITKAEREALPIRDLERDLQLRIVLSLAPDQTVLVDHIAACSNAGIFRFIDPNYRKARRNYLAMLAVPVRPKRDQMWADYRSLFDYRSKIEKFQSNERFRSVFGIHFDGIKTQFNVHKGLAAWLGQIREAFSYTEDGKRIAQSVWRLPVSAIESLKGDKQAAAKAALAFAAEVCSEAGALIPNSLKDTESESVSETRQKLSKARQAIKEATDRLSVLGFPSSFDIDEIESAVIQLKKFRTLGRGIRENQLLQELFPESFAGITSDFHRILKTVNVFNSIAGSDFPAVIREWLISPHVSERIASLRRHSETLCDFVRQLDERHDAICSISTLDTTEWYSTFDSFKDLEKHSVRKRAELAMGGKDELAPWVLYLQAREKFVNDSSGSAVVEIVEAGEIEPSQAKVAYEFAVFNSLVTRIFAELSVVERFSGVTHNQVRERFAKLDKETIRLYRDRAAYIIDQRQIPLGNGHGPVRTFTEAALLQHEISKQRRHIPIRQLIRRAGRALQALKPCFMMGPLSVAQYLAPGDFRFDFVVMDEASQLKPEDALGAVARGSQLIIVGDRKQLPPTSFFDRLGEEEPEEDENNLAQTLEDSESILDVANAVYQPSRMLRWHYRSRHASLIAFSNREFYDEKLVVFPSPFATGDRLGVRFFHVSDGLYAHRRNLREAERILDAAFACMTAEPHLSLGIVAMNSTQRDLIEEIFLKRLMEEGVAETYLETMKERGEPFFVKNLENVQGDERDVVLISMTYGPNEHGRVFQRFGPINSAVGHRRLNVLFTRSRCRVEVFSSILPDQILAGADSSLGVRSLKAYLEYARTGVLETLQFSGREPDSDFEIEVASAIKEIGYETVAQVGVAGFYIDLAVTHPHKRDSFLLGVECDGAPYHSSRSARDRDRLRESVLNDLGWKLHRIWSVDWYRNRAREQEKIRLAIDRALDEQCEN